MVNVIGGNQRSLMRPRSLENGVYCAPSMRTGKTMAPDLSATRPGPG
jgi:hypothetical protein